jgi:predicted dehydrogenase/threonine dehydrogenase-like Zn-dependent dehydrogenase
MKQLLQNMHNGQTVIEDVPIPSVRNKFALVKTACSLVSAGTERMLVEFAEKNLVQKATSRPDLVKQVLSKAQREGLLPTIEATFNRLDQPMPLGYSSAGTIVEVGSGLDGFAVGDRVACGGGNYAVHAEYALVPRNLLIKLPDTVDFESAAFTTLGAIAMQGFRLAKPQLGDRVCVIGLGLLGLLAAQIARAAGCTVFGIDLSAKRVQLANEMGFKAVERSNCEEAAQGFNQNRGFDIVLICADTPANDPIELAGKLARDHGSVVAIGAVGLNIPRKVYYEKELDFKVSRSYGPGRYDPTYEEGGQDYPFGYIRWTEGRNMESFVELMAAGKVDVHPLISHRFEIESASTAYELITGKTGVPFLGVLLTYPAVSQNQSEPHKVSFPASGGKISSQKLKVGVLGSGNYAMAVFLPAVKKNSKAELVGIASGAGLTAEIAARRFGFRFASSREQDILTSADINTVVLLTRHQQHARQVLACLQNGKNVYCEKPLALNEQELDEIQKALQVTSAPLLTVGFNRRFSPFGVALQQFFANHSEPLFAHYRINAGFLPASHWTQDPVQGGGRIIGESCHFIDLLTFLVGSAPVSVRAVALPDGGRYHQDNVSMSFRFGDGSLGVVDYIAAGNKNTSKERVEVFSAGKIGLLDDFRTLELSSEGNRTIRHAYLRQDKGHQAAWSAFCNAISQGTGPTIPYDQLIGVTLASFAVMSSLQTGEDVDIRSS